MESGSRIAFSAAGWARDVLGSPQLRMLAFSALDARSLRAFMLLPSQLSSLQHFASHCCLRSFFLSHLHDPLTTKQWQLADLPRLPDILDAISSRVSPTVPAPLLPTFQQAHREEASQRQAASGHGAEGLSFSRRYLFDILVPTPFCTFAQF